MSALSELTPEQGVERALAILLENGWEPNKYYANWEAYAGEELQENEEDYSNYGIAEREGAWQALLSGYTSKQASNGDLTAGLAADQGDGLAHDSEVYFVVLSLSDSSGNTRFFKRDGWYASYDGGHLEEGTDSEVFPKQVSLTVFEGN